MSVYLLFKVILFVILYYYIIDTLEVPLISIC